MQPIEIEGRTVAEAVEAALKQSGLRRDQVEITVVEEGAAGFLGMGAKPARVRLTEKRWGPDSPRRRTRRPSPSPHPGPPGLRVRRRRRPDLSFRRRPTSRRNRRPPRPRSAAHRAPRRDEARSERREPRERDAQRPSFRPATPEEAVEACAKAQQLVVELLRLMTIAAPTAAASWDAEMERVKIVVESQTPPSSSDGTAACWSPFSSSRL